MKVIELIEKLQKLSPDFDITIEGYNIKNISKCLDAEKCEIFYVIEK